VAEQADAIPAGMRRYYLGWLHKGPAWTAVESPQVEELQTRHLAYLQALRERGKLVLVGPLVDDGPWRGASVFAAASLEEARALMEGDPAVQAGRFTCEVHPWLVPEGILPE
jgi:uncharacterized protein YciI